MTDVPSIAEEPIGSLTSGPSPAAGFLPSITEDDTMAALGDFLTAILGIEVVQGEDNLVPQPKSKSFAVMSPRRRNLLSTTTHEEIRNEDGERVDVQRQTEAVIQVDIYGPASTDQAQTFVTLFRNAYGCNFFEGYNMQPLYCDNGQQMPLINGEFQYERRWMIMASLQINPVVSTPAQFADSVQPIITEVA